ncbi:DEAD/DEAH box helicase [soil metagenome]
MFKPVNCTIFLRTFAENEVVTVRHSDSEIIFQRDGQMLVTPGANRADVASAVRLCAQLETITAGSYLFRLSPVAIWGSTARGLDAQTILERLNRHASSPVPAQVGALVAQHAGRFGAIWIERGSGGESVLRSREPSILAQLGLQDGCALPHRELGSVKVRLAAAGWPVVDQTDRNSLDQIRIGWKPGVALRPYQRDAVEAHRRAGHGLVLLPCGAGKTMVGVGAAVEAAEPTLVLAPSREIASQWRRAFLSSTTVDPKEVSIVTGNDQPTQFTITTYQSASSGRVGSAIASRAWGLAIYDEVQSLPANVFRTVSAISAVRRLGLSATLVREDGREAEVFAMVGPAVFDLPWIELEREGWIAPALCYEVRIPRADTARDRGRYKHAVIQRIIERHNESPVLIVGSNVQSLTAIANRFDLPILTGKDSTDRREEVFQAFRSGEISRLVVSRIGSVGLDLPSAEVMIQVNGNFGSRQEEAQRLGRLLRPGDGRPVHFYTLVSLGTREPEYARHRQRFLVDQGYEYEIWDAADLPRSGP